MENPFLEYLKRYSFLHLEDLKMLNNLASIRKFKKGDILVRSGEASQSIFIVVKGLLRSYAMTSDGDEMTLTFAHEGMELADPNAVFANKAALASIEALEPTIVILLDSIKLEALSKKYHRLTYIQNHALKRIVVQAAERIHFFTVLSPEERFLYIQKEQPELIQRVPQKYLASYIGVTAVSFSRIKARLATVKKKRD